MSNGSYGNGPSQARLIIAAAAGILAFLLTKFAWHHGFWWALLIGVVVFGIVIALWSMLGGSSDAGYSGTRSGGGSAASSAPASSPPASSASVAPASTPAAAPAMAEASARDAAVSSTPVAAPAAPAPPVSAASGLMAEEDARLAPAAKPAGKPPAGKPKAPKSAAKAEKAPKAAVAKAEKAPKAAVAKAEKAPKAAVAKAGKAPKAAVVTAEKAPKAAVVKAEKAPRAVAKAKAPKAEKPAGPEILKAPRGGKADDLKMIEGIGPALEKMVNGFGVFHFDQIAKWTAKDIASFDDRMERFKGRIARDKWVAQARIIVKDGLEAFLERAKTNDY